MFAEPAMYQHHDSPLFHAHTAVPIPSYEPNRIRVASLILCRL